jgi:osmoprotectant transport system permease protein
MFEYLINNSSKVLQLTIEHLYIVFFAIILSIITALPIGIYIHINKKYSKVIIRAANVLMTIPSIAMFGILLPLLAPLNLSLGKTPAIIALILYNQLPIINNTYAALQSIDMSIVDAAKGIGLSKYYILKEVTIPLSLPIILSGIRVAAIMSIGIASIAAYIGSGGLGVLIQQGITRIYIEMVLTGAILISIIAIMIDLLMRFIEDMITPKGISIARRNLKK